MIENDIFMSRLGVYAGLIICLAVIGLGAIMTFNGQELGGLAAVVTALVALAGAFAYGTRSRRKERVQKARIAAGAEPKPDVG